VILLIQRPPFSFEMSYMRRWI